MALEKSQRSLRAWTKQDWGTKSGKKSSETGERYLPKAARESLTSAEYAATTAKKRKDTAAGKQVSKQPERIAKKTRGARQFKQIGGPVKRQNLDARFHDRQFPPADFQDLQLAKESGSEESPEAKRYYEKERLYKENYENYLQDVYKFLKDKHNIVVKEVDFKAQQDKFKEYKDLPKAQAVLNILKDSGIPLRERPEAAIMQVLEERPREHIMPSRMIKNDLARDVFNIAKRIMTPTPLHKKGFNIIKNRVSLLNFVNPKKELTIVLDKNKYPDVRESILVEELKHVHQLRGLDAIKNAVKGSLEQIADAMGKGDRYGQTTSLEGIHRRKEEFEPELKKYGYTPDEDRYFESQYFDPDTYN